MNKLWHEQHKMPVKPTDKQRAEWHIAHLEYCACRKPTLKIQQLIDEYKSLQISVPKPPYNVG